MAVTLNEGIKNKVLGELAISDRGNVAYAMNLSVTKEVKKERAKKTVLGMIFGVITAFLSGGAYSYIHTQVDTDSLNPHLIVFEPMGITVIKLVKNDVSLIEETFFVRWFEMEKCRIRRRLLTCILSFRVGGIHYKYQLSKLLVIKGCGWVKSNMKNLIENRFYRAM